MLATPTEREEPEPLDTGYERSAGNKLGYTSLGVGAFSPILGNIMMKRATPPNINVWEGYGADAQKKFDTGFEVHSR